MRNRIKKILLGFGTILTFCFGLLVLFMLKPSLSYAHQTTYQNITIYHNQPISPTWESIIDTSLVAIQETALYNKNLKVDLCLNDGSNYPKVIKTILGNDIFRAFANKVVDLSEATDEYNRIQGLDKKLKTTQFLTHALLHNLQFKYHGLWDANPLGNHPNWKWEGYVEYETLGHSRTLETILATINNDKEDFEWVELGNDERTLKIHIRYLAITKYCFDILKMDYSAFMKDKRTEGVLFEELIEKYSLN